MMDDEHQQQQEAAGPSSSQQEHREGQGAGPSSGGAGGQARRAKPSAVTVVDLTGDDESPSTVRRVTRGMAAADNARGAAAGVWRWGVVSVFACM